MDTLLKVPVTALEFSKEFLIAGEGPYVKLFDVQKGSLLCREHVLPRRRIHGISLAVENKGERLLALFGQTDIRIARLKGNRNLSVVGEVVQFSDWILDVKWLNDHQESLATPDSMAVAMAHNQVTLWNWKNKRIVALVDCEVQCIIYSFRLHGCQSQTLWAASGTVFHDILLWPVVATKTKARVAARLQGHKGVIFSIRFNSSGHLLCSASDDRSICLWNTAAAVGEGSMGQMLSNLHTSLIVSRIM
jgi:WD40 repeat protein